MISTYKDTRAGSGQKANGIKTIVDLLIGLGVDKSIAEKQGRMYYRYLEMPEVNDIIEKLKSKDALSWVMAHPIFSKNIKESINENDSTDHWIQDIQSALTKSSKIDRNVYLLRPEHIKTLINILNKNGHTTKLSEDGKTLTIHKSKKPFKEFYKA